ncbi:unnamed protein product [Ilex paraguariensis]|uniref:Uncharacterized protein n=1 Tax=Ilex paraguariensis TaxID=185542 RepID=A0ABC8S801_9AQUA
MQQVEKMKLKVETTKPHNYIYRLFMTSIMEQPPSNSKLQDEPEFSLKEWTIKARISRENTRSRRFSASNLRSFREDTRSFRSNITISSTASSPGYLVREEIDPSTYSFTTALNALQARTINTWECLSPDGFALNSKWNEAEKYICNPLSGEVPMECLSAKTLSGRSFRHLTSRITMSAPLIYPSHSRLIHSKPYVTTPAHEVHVPKQEKKRESMTRDVGTQSTPPDLSSSSPSPAPTPSIEERSIKCSEAEGGYSSNFSAKGKSEDEVEVKEARKQEDTKKVKQMCRCRQGGCLSWRSLLMRKRQRDKHKPSKKNIFPALPH